MQLSFFPSLPHELSFLAVCGLEERRRDRLGQTGIVEAHDAVASRRGAAGLAAPGGADLGAAGVDAEGRCAVADAVVVGHEARFDLGGERADRAEPAALFRRGEDANDSHGHTSFCLG